MDTSISRLADFRAPPPYPKLEAFEEKPAQGMTPEHLDRLDALTASIISNTGGLAVSPRTWSRNNRIEYNLLSVGEQIYVALAANKPELIASLRMTIPEAIDRLGWVDASAMVARWRNRRA